MPPKKYKATFLKKSKSPKTDPRQLRLPFEMHRGDIYPLDVYVPADTKTTTKE